MSLAMTKQEREAFLADLHVGVISIEEPGRGPLTVPIWYDYQPGGELWIITDRGSRKGKAPGGGRALQPLRPDGDRPLQVRDRRGTDRLRRGDGHGARGPLHGPPLSRSRSWGTSTWRRPAPTRSERETVCFRMRPEHWLTVDYAKQFSQL